MNLRRILPIAVGAAVVVAVGAYVVHGQQQQEQKAKRARANQDQPAPVLAARASITDVPIYLDAVGNTARAQYRDGARAGRRADRQDRLQGRPGRRARLRARRDRSAHLSGAVRSGRRQEGAGRGDARQRAHRSRPLHPARRVEFRLEAAGRHPEGAGRAARSAGAGRSGGDRQHQDDAELHQDRLADRRAHRHPPDRRGQSGAGERRQRHRGDHADQADLGAVQPAAAAVPAGERRLRQRPARRSTRWRSTARPSSIAAPCR